jgi:hypothetical protein
MTEINKIIKDNLIKIGKKESNEKDFIQGVENVALKLIKEVLNGNAVTSSDIESSIDKIVSKKAE